MQNCSAKWRGCSITALLQGHVNAATRAWLTGNDDESPPRDQSAWKGSGEQPRIFRMAFYPRRGVRTGRHDLPAHVTGRFQCGLHQRASNATAADSRGDFGVGDGHHRAGELVFKQAVDPIDVRDESPVGRIVLNGR